MPSCDSTSTDDPGPDMHKGSGRKTLAIFNFLEQGPDHLSYYYKSYIIYIRFPSD